MYRCSDATGRLQRGDALLEALLGVLLTAIIGAGLAHVLARTLSNRADAKLENAAVMQLRSQLQTQGRGLCTGTTGIQKPTGGNIDVSVSCGPVEATVSVIDPATGTPVLSSTGASLSRDIAAPEEISLSVAASDLQLTGAGSSAAPLVVGNKQ